jgi:hypothetical protein
MTLHEHVPGKQWFSHFADTVQLLRCVAAISSAVVVDKA